MGATIINGSVKTGTFKPNTRLKNVATGAWETALVNTTYYSPNQFGGLLGAIYRKYYTGTFISSTTETVILEASFSGTPIFSAGTTSLGLLIPLKHSNYYVQQASKHDGDLIVEKVYAGLNNHNYWVWVDYYE